MRYFMLLKYLISNQSQSLNQENTKSQEALKKSIEHISKGLRLIDVQIKGMSKALHNTNEALSAA
jgi:flagellin